MHGYNFERFANYNELKDKKQYVVKAGDSLYSIATKHKISVNELMNLNKLTSTMIYPNQILFIPTPVVKDSVSYVTKQNETISDVLKNSKFDFDELMMLQVVSNQVVTSTKKKEPTFHEIQIDDDLLSILNKYNLDYESFMMLNKDNFLKTGNKVRIN